MFSPGQRKSPCAAVAPGTQNLNQLITYYPVFGEHNERDHPADSRPGRYADPADKAAFPADLRHAARDIGFFYLINHGVDDALQYEVQRQSQRFFALDEAQKQQVAMIHSPIFAAITARPQS